MLGLLSRISGTCRAVASCLSRSARIADGPFRWPRETETRDNDHRSFLEYVRQTALEDTDDECHENLCGSGLPVRNLLRLWANVTLGDYTAKWITLHYAVTAAVTVPDAGNGIRASGTTDGSAFTNFFASYRSLTLGREGLERRSGLDTMQHAALA